MNSMAFLSTRKQAWKLLVQLGSRSYYNDGLHHSTRPTTVNPLKPIRQEEEDMEVDEEDDAIMAMATMTNQRLTWYVRFIIGLDILHWIAIITWIKVVVLLTSWSEDDERGICEILTWVPEKLLLYVVLLSSSYHLQSLAPNNSSKTRWIFPVWFQMEDDDEDEEKGHKKCVTQWRMYPLSKYYSICVQPAMAESFFL
ncbi:hypothetical protein AAC387_Pa01g1883 [Persea americana]